MSPLHLYVLPPLLSQLYLRPLPLAIKISVPKMVTNTFVCCVFYLWLAVSLGSAEEDPELLQCKHQCRVQQKASEREKQECEQKCEDYYREHRGPVVDPEKQLRQCRKQCELLPIEQREQCIRECQERYDQKKRGVGDEEGKEEDNPFVFQDQHFASHRTDQGEVKILKMFGRRSPLLRGLNNYRFVCLEVNPRTFVIPTYYDAEIVGFVAGGQGTITMVRQGKRRSFIITTGDTIRILAGTTVHLINSHKKQKLRIAYFMLPVGVPGRFEAFHGPAGENPRSFYRAFSPKVLSSALKVEEGTLKNALKQQSKGQFIKASEEQIRALSGQHNEADGTFGDSVEFKRAIFNLLNKKPSVSNNYGRLNEADADDFRQLRDMDIKISYANISKVHIHKYLVAQSIPFRISYSEFCFFSGRMMGSFYNSRSTMVAVVVAGEGFFQMACPHFSGEDAASPVYRRVSSSLRPGLLFIVLTGHPIAIIAGLDRNLEIVCFVVNAENNRKEPLAGKGNVVNGLEKVAKELAFALPAGEVDKIFRKQKEELFFPGPKLQHHHHHHKDKDHHKGHASA